MEKKVRRGGGRGGETERGKELLLSAVARVQVHNDKMQSPNGGNVPFPSRSAFVHFSLSKASAGNGYPNFNKTL